MFEMPTPEEYNPIRKTVTMPTSFPGDSVTEGQPREASVTLIETEHTTRRRLENSYPFYKSINVVNKTVKTARLVASLSMHQFTGEIHEV